MPASTDPAVLRARLLAAIVPEARAAVGRIIAQGGDARVYAVGGFIRDAIIGRPPVDIDLAIGADAIDIVRAALPRERVTTHVRFGTASVTIAGSRIDVATTRSETYARAGALPKVATARIDADLRRRDFTVNALALTLNGAPTLIDPCGGLDDIAKRRIRVLHDRSFGDDATRVFRALRYAARLGFTLEPHTFDLLYAGISHVATIGGERLRRELELMLAEDSAGSALEAADATGALAAVHAALSWDAARTAALGYPAARHAKRTNYGFALLALHATPEDAEAITARLRLKRDEAAAVSGIAALRRALDMLARPDAKPSGVALLLDRFPVAAVATLAAADDSIAGQTALRYLEEWRGERPILTGRDLQDMGVPVGPNIQRGLQLIRAARLDGWASDRGDEQALVLRFAKSIRDSGAMSATLDLKFNGN